MKRALYWPLDLEYVESRPAYQQVLGGLAIILFIVALFLSFMFSHFVYMVSHMMDDPQYRFQNNITLSLASRDNIQIYNKDGDFLVNGSIERISYEAGSWRNVVLVAYRPNQYYWYAKNRNMAAPEGAKMTIVARIDLRNQDVTELPDPDGAIAKSLQPVMDWF